jgi:hypothetical protein
MKILLIENIVVFYAKKKKMLWFDKLEPRVF